MIAQAVDLNHTKKACFTRDYAVDRKKFANIQEGPGLD
jgi:hypothetical protein